jgi:hypothetical protein
VVLKHQVARRLKFLFLEAGKAQCIPPQSLTFFSFGSILYNKLDCALSLHELIGTIVVLSLPS